LLDALHEDLNLSKRKGVIPIEDKEEETDDIPDPVSNFMYIDVRFFWKRNG
jgi:hypothetical protein